MLLACVTTLSAQTIATGSPAPPQPPTLAAIQQQIDRGHAADALAELDKMAAASGAAPTPAAVERLRGQAFYSEDKLQEAEAAFGAALARDPADTVSTLMRGITLFRLGRPAAAIPPLEAAIKAVAAEAKQQAKEQGEPANGPVDPQYVLALCYLDTRRYDDARRAFAMQYGFAPDSAPAYLLAARMLLRREYIPVAQQFAHKALEISPQLPLAHRLLGEAELADNHLDAAVAEFEQERKSNPLDSGTYDRLGDAYIRRGDYDSARQVLQEAVLLEPNFTGPFILLGKVLLKQQNPVGAARYLEHAVAMDSQNFIAHSLLGQAYRQMGRTDEARTETDTAQKLQAATEPKLVDGH